MLTKLKSKRITQACDFCHRRGVKCKTQSDHRPCLTCVEYGQECTRTRQPKKRGTKPRADTRSNGEPEILASVGGIANRGTITRLLDVYLDSIHPKCDPFVFIPLSLASNIQSSFPLFCERELWVKWRDGSFPQDDSDFMSLMCLCALSAQHIGAGALFNDDIDALERKNLQEAYTAEATRLVPVDFTRPDLNLVRSYTFLALLGAQTGDNAMLHKYLGLCHGICALLNLHDESRWPVLLDPCDQEIRRRLWWSIYRLEVHTACVLGNIVRSPETRCGVGYPVGAHHPAFIPGRNGHFEDWFDGWNATTDLYRVLEHAISDLRTKHRPGQSILGRGSGGSDPGVVMARLAQIQERLLPQFVTPASRSDDNGRNRCGFQAPNIICTIHLARLLSCVSGDDPGVACRVARDLVMSIKAVPLEYIRATGSPLIQQLAGVGHVLVGIARKHSLAAEEYVQITQVTHSIIGLLELLAGQSNVTSATRDRLTILLAEVEEIYALRINTDTGPAILTGDEDSPVFPNGLLTDFTWLYPAHP
ncbi:hypothetical protein BJX99DRAFT_265661 [Aspergillus californicus]